MASEYLKWKYRNVRPETPVELTPRQKRLNWWHYHKWHVLTGAFLAVTAVYLLTRALGFWEIQPDYQIAYVGSAALPEDTAAALESSLAELGTDCNDDGRVTVRLNQFVTESDPAGDAALYSYADSTRLMADLDSCDSYFFLLEDPEGFQKDYEVLRRLDGKGFPGDDDAADYCVSWSACPVLRELPLGQYTETFLGQEFSGESQELLAGLSLARRDFLTEKTVRYPAQCDELWTLITKGALP